MSKPKFTDYRAVQISRFGERNGLVEIHVTDDWGRGELLARFWVPYHKDARKLMKVVQVRIKALKIRYKHATTLLTGSTFVGTLPQPKHN